MAGASGERLQAIGGLRAVAALGVFGGHAMPWITPGGGNGVDVFFVLSGFLITGVLVRMDEKDGTIRLGEFYRRRALRIWPALFALLLLLTTIYLITQDGKRLLEVAFAATATMNFARMFGITGGGSLGHTWTLGAVEQFYLIWPLLLAFTPALKHKVQFVLGLLALFALLCAVRTTILVYRPIDDFHSDGIILGCILAIWRPVWFDRVSTQLWPVALGALAVLYLTVPGASTPLYFWSNVASALLACCLISAAAQGQRMRPLELAPLVWLGERSYGFYLWHFPIIGVMNATGLAAGVRVPVALLLSIGMAALSYRFIEQPILRYGLSRPRPMAAALAKPDA